MYFETVCNGSSRSSKVVDLGTSQKRVRIYVFLSVINSNFGPVLLRFRDIAGFLLRTATQPLFDQNFGLNWASKSEEPMLVIRVIICEVIQLI